MSPSCRLRICDPARLCSQFGEPATGDERPRRRSTHAGRGDFQRMPTWQVIVLGLIEGLTEFIPVSSTGHILLAGHFLGFDSPEKTFEILIQLGAILAILTVYAAELWHMARDLPHDRRTQESVAAVVLAFLPAAI